MDDQAESRADQERSRADRAERSLEYERSRADALRDRLEAAKAELQQAQQTADALRLAEREGRAKGDGAPVARLGRLEGEVRMTAAGGDLRRAVRLASWRPQVVLRRVWSRLRATWWER